MTPKELQQTYWDTMSEYKKLYAAVLKTSKALEATPEYQTYINHELDRTRKALHQARKKYLKYHQQIQMLGKSPNILGEIMTIKEQYARKFGLPVDQIRYYEELTEQEQEEVCWQYGHHRIENYVYAVKRGGGLVWRRVKR